MSYVLCPDCHKRIVDKRRYPVEPLADWMGMSLSQACITVGISGSTQKTARCHGLGRQSIESVAGKLRVHPSEIWPEVIDHDIEDASRVCAADKCEERFMPRNQVHLYCSPRCKARMKQRRYRATEHGAAINRRVTAEWKVQCADYYHAWLRAYNERNSEAKREYGKRWRRENRDHVNAYRREWRAKKRSDAA